MMWNHYAWTGGDRLAMLLLMVSILVAFGALIGLLVRRDPPRSDQPQDGPHDVLADRYARGEIDDDEYDHRSAVLHGAGHR